MNPIILLPSQWVLCFLTAITMNISLKATSFLRPCALGWNSRVIFPMDCSRIPFHLVYSAVLSRAQWPRPSGLVQRQVARWPCPGWPEGEVASAPPACAASPDRDPLPVKPGWCGAAADLSPYTHTAAVDRRSLVNRQHCLTPLSIYPHSSCGQVITGKQTGTCKTFNNPFCTVSTPCAVFKAKCKGSQQPECLYVLHTAVAQCFRKAHSVCQMTEQVTKCRSG